MFGYIESLYYSLISVLILTVIEVLYLFRNTKRVQTLLSNLERKWQKIADFYEATKNYATAKILPTKVKFSYFLILNIALVLNAYTITRFININFFVVLAFLLFIEFLYLYLQKSKEFKENLFDKNFSDVLSVFASTYNVTESIEECIKSASKYLKSYDLRAVFNNAKELVESGQSFSKSLEYSLKQFESSSSTTFLNLIRINQSRGINLSFIFEKLAMFNTRNTYLKKESKNILYQTRLSSLITSLLVPIIVMLLMLISKDYFNALINTDTGKSLIVLCLIWYLIGVYMIHKTLKDAVFQMKKHENV